MTELEPTETTIQTRRREPEPAQAIAPLSIEATLDKAVERGMDPVGLEKLIALYARMQAMKAEKAFNVAMNEFKRLCPAIMKRRKADIRSKDPSKTSYSYWYADLEEMTKAVDPPLRAQGLSYSWDSRMEGPITSVTCTIHHVEGHKRSATFSCETEIGGGPGQKSKPQAARSTNTFCERASLEMVLGVTTDLDEDGRRPIPLPAPEADADAPKVGTREERQAEEGQTPKVDAKMLNGLLVRWSNHRKGKEWSANNPSTPKFTDWARWLLKTDVSMALPTMWTIDAFELCSGELS